ncbi:hypothetical protein [Roseovarius salis]|uniref:hypothetical protein n=1 Tax=Roseovarius salis TaxID=3376063 RepID=UPI0037C9E472
MSPIKSLILSALAAGLAAGCSPGQADVRQFEVRVDGGFHTVTETRPTAPILGAARAPMRTVRVNGRDVPCAELPCAREVRAARGQARADIDAFRKPPPGADLTTE